jgi:hypothetical protein
MDNILEERKKNYRRVNLIDLNKMHEDNKSLLRKKHIDECINKRRLSGKTFKLYSFEDMMIVENLNNILKNAMNNNSYEYLLTIDILDKIIRYLEDGIEYDNIFKILDFVYNNLIRLAMREEYSDDCVLKLVKMFLI